MARRKKKKSSFDFIVILVMALFAIYMGVLGQSKADEVNNVTTSSGENLEVHFIDVGQADAILIHCKNENALIDAGKSDSDKKLTSYFNSLGINEFKYVFGTHAHEDHIGSMDTVILKYKIGKFFMPDVITTTKTFEDVLDALDKKEYKFDTPKIDEEFFVCGAKIRVLYVGNNEKDLNSTSIIARLDYGNTSFLFTGDTTSEVEGMIYKKNVKADVLKVAHHGSQYSSTLRFLKEVAPKYAVISVGEKNTYNHPSDIILNRLKVLNVETYRTDKFGTIIAESDGNVIQFKTEK